MKGAIPPTACACMPGNEGPSRLRLTPWFACPLASCFLSLACGFHAQIALANLHKPTAPKPTTPNPSALADRAHADRAMPTAPSSSAPNPSALADCAIADSHADTERTARKEKLNKQKWQEERIRHRLEAAHAATIGRERCAPRPGRQRHCTQSPPSHAHARMLARMHARRQAAIHIGFTTCV